MPLRPASAVRTPARSLLHHKQDSTQRQPHAGSVFEVSLGERIEGGGGEGQEEGLTYGGRRSLLALKRSMMGLNSSVFASSKSNGAAERMGHTDTHIHSRRESVRIVPLRTRNLSRLWVRRVARSCAHGGLVALARPTSSRCLEVCLSVRLPVCRQGEIPH